MDTTVSPIVRLENISKRFPGVQALADVSLEVYPGEIHAIVGENGAGKSTLMNILAGEHQPDAGRLIIEGREVHIPNPYVSQQMGISVVYQELALCPNLSVAENISLHVASVRPAMSFVRRSEFEQIARHVLEQLGMGQIDLSKPAGQLTIAQQQLVEIAKAISINAKILILDEPNSALTQEETEHLFSILQQLWAKNVAILYVSHRLEEVLRIADRITVLRDGKLIDTLPAAGATVRQIITKMVGRSIDEAYRRSGGAVDLGDVKFEVRDLHSGKALRGVSFCVRAGEIVGIAGLPDSGKDELVECCFGLRRYTGEIHIDGEIVAISSPDKAIREGVTLIPADRRGKGALLLMSVQDNVTASDLTSVSRGGFLDRGAIRVRAEEYVRSLDIRVGSLTQKMMTLSGGNQQKTIIARALATHPSVLLLHEPTRGIDVGAKAEIYHILRNLASEGVAILIVSSELPELLTQCDRILAMHDGRLTGDFLQCDATEEDILACAMGQEIHLYEGENQQ